jgi:hypothetical protein
MIQRATILYFMKSFQFQCLQDPNVRLSIDRNMKIWSWKAEVLIQTKLFWFEQECVPSSKMTPSVAVLATSRRNGGLKTSFEVCSNGRIIECFGQRVTQTPHVPNCKTLDLVWTKLILLEQDCSRLWKP